MGNKKEQRQSDSEIPTFIGGGEEGRGAEKQV